MIRVAVLDHDPNVRDRVAAVLAEEPEIDVAGRHSGVVSLLASLADDDVHVAVLGVRLPSTAPAEVCVAVREVHPRVRLVVRTDAWDESVLVATLASGARGFVLDRSPPTILRHAVRAVAGGGTFIDPGVAGTLVRLALVGQRAQGPHGLSLQELRVLERLPRGLTNGEIGVELGITESTVKDHVRAILRKLDADDRSHAAAVAVRSGLV